MICFNMHRKHVDYILQNISFCVPQKKDSLKQYDSEYMIKEYFIWGQFHISSLFSVVVVSNDSIFNY